MAIDKQTNLRSGAFILKIGRCIILLSLLFPLVLVSCAELSIDKSIGTGSIRPITKIGLIAPFEGIYRRAGYESLAAMRSALADYAALMQNAGIDVLPVALDDSGDPQRASRTAQKLMSDPAVGAVIGPISLWTAYATVDTLSASMLHWERPYLAGQAEEAWLTELLSAVNQASLQQGAERLLIIDRGDGWLYQKENLWREIDGLPMHIVNNATDDATDDATDTPQELLKIVIDGASTSANTSAADQVRATDAVLFLGSPADAAAFVSSLRQKHETVPFWLGPQGGDPILYERAARVDKVYWATWLDAGYEEWIVSHQPATPSAYLVYKATERAVHTIVDPAKEFDSTEPKVYLFSVESNGISIPYQP